MNRIILHILIFLLLSPSPAFAGSTLSGPEIEALIEKAKVFKQGQKTKALSTPEEVIVSTYRASDSTRINNDCKIDAALVAKALMVDNDTGIRRVRVHFHEPSLKGNFREVVVTYAEIKAFANKIVDKDDFLKSISIKLIPEKGKPAYAGKKQYRSTKRKRENKSKRNDSQRVNSGELFYSNKSGIQFLVPDGWVARENRFKKSKVVTKLRNKTTKKRNIVLSLVRGKKNSPTKCAMDIKKRFSYAGVEIKKYSRIRFGNNKGHTGAIIVLTYPNHKESGKRYYEMHLFFSNKGRVFDLWGWSSKSDYRRVYPAFNAILSTLKIPSKSQ